MQIFSHLISLKIEWTKAQDASESIEKYKRRRKLSENDEATPESIENFKRRQKSNYFVDESDSNEFLQKSSEEYEPLYKRQGKNLMANELYWREAGLPAQKKEKRVTFKRWNGQGMLRKGQGGDGWKSWGDSWKINY